MYEFEDPQLEQLLVQRERDGVAVRVILDNGYFGAGSSANEQAFDYLRSNGVAVHWSPQYFALTHEKAMVVDNTEALIMTFNFSPQYYKSDRDFGILDNDMNDVSAVEAAFDEDWNGNQTQAQNDDDLVWSPNSRTQLLALISSAQTSLDIYNEEMQDPQIISALAAAAQRGVNVEVVMTYADEWKDAFQELSNAGVHVRTYAANAPLYIHAKVIIADDKQAFVGSENFSSTSLDQNRELGVMVSDPAVVASLSKTFAQDQQNATPFLASAPWQTICACFTGYNNHHAIGNTREIAQATFEDPGRLAVSNPDFLPRRKKAKATGTTRRGCAIISTNASRSKCSAMTKPCTKPTARSSTCSKSTSTRSTTPSAKKPQVYASIHPSALSSRDLRRILGRVGQQAERFDRLHSFRDRRT